MYHFRMLMKVGMLKKHRYNYVAIEMYSILSVYMYIAWIKLLFMHNTWHTLYSLDTQDIPLEDIADRCETKFTTKTFMVSSIQTRPDDMHVSMTINGGQTPSTVAVERKASKRCGCQVFYFKEGINCWKIIFTFFLEHLDNVSFTPGNILCWYNSFAYMGSSVALMYRPML